MVRTKQGGSILSFVILGVVMALLLIGGVYAVRHYLSPKAPGAQVATSGEDNGSSKQTPNSSNNQTTPPQKSDQSGSSSNSGQNTPSNNSQTSGNGGSGSTNQPAATPPASSGQTSSGLPTTGPSSVLFVGMMLSSLVATLTAYIQSRRFWASL